MLRSSSPISWMSDMALVCRLDPEHRACLWVGSGAWSCIIWPAKLEFHSNNLLWLLEPWQLPLFPSPHFQLYQQPCMPDRIVEPLDQKRPVGSSSPVPCCGQEVIGLGQVRQGAYAASSWIPPRRVTGPPQLGVCFRSWWETTEKVFCYV